jgi:hypothetical protein
MSVATTGIYLNTTAAQLHDSLRRFGTKPLHARYTDRLCRWQNWQKNPSLGESE